MKKFIYTVFVLILAVGLTISTATTVMAVNNPPTADAGPDQIVEQTSLVGADVTLDGSGSFDPDGDPLDFFWTWDGGSETGMNPTGTFPLGATDVTLVVTDSLGQSDSDTVVITVADTTPPDVWGVESVNPNGKTPPAGSTTLPGPKGGQNEDGFYQLLAEDICDSDPQIFVADASGVVFGPFSSGDVVKITEDPTAIPEIKPMGGPNSAVVAHIILVSDASVFAVDASGNVSSITLLVPPLPK